MEGLLSRLLFVTLFMTALISHPADTMAANAIESLAGGNTAFAVDLYARLKTADGNLFFSPYSISTCLAMTYAGARGDTAAQTAKTLHFDTNQLQLAASFGELQKQLNSEQEKKGIELNIANGLWGQKDHLFLPAFLDIAKQSYGATLKQVDFRTHADTARTEINDWVDHKTRGKITDLIQPGVLDPAMSAKPDGPSRRATDAVADQSAATISRYRSPSPHCCRHSCATAGPTPESAHRPQPRGCFPACSPDAR